MIRPTHITASSAALEAYQQAVHLYKKGEYKDALRQLVTGFQADINYKPLYFLARDVLGKLGGTEERRLFAIALNEFEQFQPFFDLGYHFIDTEHYPLAIVFLKKALALKPDNKDAAYELAFAYMARFQIQQALNVLASVDYESDFWLAYLYHQCKLWLKQPEGISDFITEARQLLMTQSITESIDIALYKIQELEDSLQRYQQVDFANSLPIREWHFIQYGAAILNYAEDDVDVAGGRYVGLWGSNENTIQVLNNLIVYLTQLKRLPKRVIAIPERESEILGRVLAQLLQVPFSTLEIMEDFSDCLMVAMDGQAFNGIEPLIDIKPNQTVFAFYQSWLERSMIVSDVVGVLAQHYWSPWEEGRLQTDAMTNKVKRLEADDRPIEILVQELLDLHSVKTNSATSTNPHLAFYLTHQDYLKGGVKGGTKRSPFTVESPVPGSYFGN